MCVTRGVAVRAPRLYRALRCFCLGAFSLLSRDLEGGYELPFALEEHRIPGRPSLYEYRPLVAAFVEVRTHRLAEQEDARVALEELRREPAAAVFARAHARPPEGGQDPLFRSIVVPLLTRTAESCGGFDWDDAAFDRAYAELERSLFSERRVYGALAPLVGLALATPVPLAPGLIVRQAVARELSAHWPEASRLLPEDFGRDPDRMCVLELERQLPAGEHELPDPAAELADAVTAIRLATAGAVAAGPVLFERLDWRPLGVRPVLPVAAATPYGEAARLDPVRGRLAAKLLPRLRLADEDRELGDALDRWELTLFQADPARSEQLRHALGALLGGAEGLWAAAVRACVLVGATGRERTSLLASLKGLAAGAQADEQAARAVRRALVETLTHGGRAELIAALDEALLGARPPPLGAFEEQATAV